MSDTVIRVENLSKKYIIGHQKKTDRHPALRNIITEWVKTAGHRALSRLLARPLPADQAHEEFWALKDVSFEIKQGDRVGIIGRNGAGKSTLLKILSRITEPTKGKIYTKGRVASLLEVGTGFHPELTGRENIFLNGAILGMSRAEIKRKFDEIVAFAEVENFLDTPVKHYSSGMYVRLAFAVAAHLEPEILVVDEVLAVGDAQFQKKCLGKMEDVSAKEGRTVLFVSHNMGAILKLCEHAILLKSGYLLEYGKASPVVSSYLTAQQNEEIALVKHAGSGGVKFKDIYITNEKSKRINSFFNDEKFHIHLDAEVEDSFLNKELVVGVGIDSELGERITTVVSSWCGCPIKTSSRTLRVKIIVNSLPVISAKYSLSAAVSYCNNTLTYVDNCSPFFIEIGRGFFEGSRNQSHGFLSIPYLFEADDVQPK
jgi:lipopolysaccharide transport system ATP-binding protein